MTSDQLVWFIHFFQHTFMKLFGYMRPCFWHSKHKNQHMVPVMMFTVCEEEQKDEPIIAIEMLRCHSGVDHKAWWVDSIWQWAGENQDSPAPRNSLRIKMSRIFHSSGKRWQNVPSQWIQGSVCKGFLAFPPLMVSASTNALVWINFP